MLGGLEVEMEMGEVTVGEPETLEVAGEEIEFVPVSVGNPHAVIRRDPERSELLASGRWSSATHASPSVQTSSSSTSTAATR